MNDLEYEAQQVKAETDAIDYGRVREAMGDIRVMSTAALEQLEMDIAVELRERDEWVYSDLEARIDDARKTKYAEYDDEPF